MGNASYRTGGNHDALSVVDSLRVAFPALYPTTFETAITHEHLAFIRTYEDASHRQHMTELTETRFVKHFARDPRAYDLHEIHFQNFCLRLYRNLTAAQRRSFLRSDPAYSRIVRAAGMWSNDHLHQRKQRTITVQNHLQCSMLLGARSRAERDMEEVASLICMHTNQCVTTINLWLCVSLGQF
jgi:hypothetical protein